MQMESMRLKPGEFREIGPMESVMMYAAEMPRAEQAALRAMQLGASPHVIGTAGFPRLTVTPNHDQNTLSIDAGALTLRYILPPEREFFRMGERDVELLCQMAGAIGLVAEAKRILCRRMECNDTQTFSVHDRILIRITTEQAPPPAPELPPLAPVVDMPKPRSILGHLVSWWPF